MIKYNTIPGFTGSEIERAGMSGGVFPMESTLERAVKQRVAKGLIGLANYIAPSNVVRVEARNMEESYC